jgi:hypothetical protein
LFSFPDAMPVMEVIGRIVTAGYLGSISSGKATWCVVSGFPIAVVAQQWTEPRLVSWPPAEASDLQTKNGVICIHFNYHTQIDPETVVEVLRKLKLHPPSS